MGELKYRLDMIKKPTWRFVNASPFAKENLLYIQESGRFCSGTNYYTVRNGLDSFLIQYTLSGKGILEYDGKKYSIIPGSIMFIDCRKSQNYYTDPMCDKWEVIWAHFNGKNAEVYYDKYTEKNDGSPVAFASSGNKISEILENIIDLSENYTKNQDSEFSADNYVNSLLNECIIQSEAGGSAPSYVNEIAYYLQHHYKDTINLDILSKTFNISKFHLQRTFKDAVGLSPAKYLSNIRINKAKKLLRGTNLSVSEISEEIGMETNYFIQLFKSLENETPHQYRNSWCGK